MLGIDQERSTARTESTQDAKTRLWTCRFCNGSGPDPWLGTHNCEEGQRALAEDQAQFRAETDAIPSRFRVRNVDPDLAIARMRTKLTRALTRRRVGVVVLSSGDAAAILTVIDEARR